MFPDECTPNYSSSLIERIFPYPGLAGGMNRDQTDAWMGYLSQFKMIPPNITAPPKARRKSVMDKPPTAPSSDDADAPAGLESVRRMMAAAKNAKVAAEAAVVRKEFDHFVASLRRNARRSAYELVSARRADTERLSGRGNSQVPGPKVALTFRARNVGMSGTNEIEVLMSAGPAPIVQPTGTASDGFATVVKNRNGEILVDIPRYRDAVTRMAQAHALGMDFCVVGPRGSGKSTALRRFAAILGYDAGYTESVHCYKEMTARDLLQRRGTRRDGSTYWENSNLVTSAIEGKLCILDGIEMLEGGTLASLQRLTQDREIPLPDGSWLTSFANFNALCARTKLSPEELISGRKVIPIHPSFRLVAMASTPLNPNSSGTLLENLPWLTEEVVNMFHFVVWGQMERLEEEEIVASVTNCPQGPMSQLFDFAQRLRFMGDDEGQGASLSKSAALSTRQLIRIGRRLAEHEDEDLYRAINRACLGPFLPLPAKETLEGLLEDVGIKERKLQKDVRKPYITSNPPRLHIGDVSIPVFQISGDDPEGAALVPRVPTTFFDNDLHTLVMREMAIDFNGGEHLLLIGNQGVGKNRLTDRFLELINRPREYIQLHRDTTVQALMVQPTVENGVIFYKDSPLVRAVKAGRVLVVDEADKAPVYITAVLKSLAENGEMNLSDGRKIRPASAAGTGAVRENDIVLHPNFRLILLANRPGYPFLGNDFYSQIGDVFSTHAVDNPDEDSELELLAQMAPEILKGRLRRLVAVFAELRRAFDDGLVSYPFSLRELINVVKHMKKYPDEPLDSVLRNVFDFDVTRKEYHDLLINILDKH
ncbi:von Willebrand factor A domain-containing protein 8, partial [Gonapodya sp. JEL0774]